VFGGASTIRVDALDLTGPMVVGQVTGRVGDGSPGADVSRAPLDLQVDIELKDDMVRSSLRNAGIRLDREGKATFRVGGNVSSPKVK
jgi:hypothetical protein